MDLAYLRSHPQQLPAFLTHQRIRETPVRGGSICTARRLTLDDGSSVFAKSLPEGSAVPPGFFEAEARGLRWLREADAVPVPEVIAELPELAALHRAGAVEFGAPWWGYIGALPLDNTPSPGPWPEWFAARRLEPYLKLSVDNGALSAAHAALVGGVLSRVGAYGGAEPPARLHGDL